MKKGYPQTQLEEVEPGTVQEIVCSLRQLHELGKPKTDQEVADRIDQYFLFCQNSKLRPGIEGLCQALSISRTTLYRWSKGEDCSEFRKELIENAKGFIAAFLEQVMLSGKISPPSGIFLMKAWLGYKDTISIEELVPDKPERKILPMDYFPVLGDSTKADDDVTLPRLDIPYDE